MPFLVVFVFLQDLRSTLIPAIAVPVSIIGTFFFLNLFGYSINLLTLFALVLAIGIVVDDAIVVVEAVHTKLDHGEKNAKKATLTAMHEIAGAIVSITLVMVAVFIPVTFVEGSTGVFYKQFGITLIIAILISAVNALTLSPALCALLLKSHNEEEELKSKNPIQRFHALFNLGFNATVSKYENALKFLFKRKWIPILLLIIAVVGIFWASKTTPTGFVPNEDRSMILANIELPVGASLDRTNEIVQELYDKSRNLPAIEDAGFIQGRSLISGAGSNYGMAFIKLKDLSERSDPSLSTDATIGKLFGIASTIKGANIIFFTPPSIPGFGFSGGFEVNLLDRFGGEFTELDKVNKEFIQKFDKPFWLINTSRGKIVNTPDLVDALNEKKILGAGLDVIDIESSSFNNLEKELNPYFNELINLKNVIITPHIAGWTFESNVKLSQIIIDKIKSLLK